MHNITEGVGIAAPLVPAVEGESGAVRRRPGETAGDPRWTTFAGLALLAGGPAILGAWLGGFTFSPLLATLFLGIGLGAIWQVIVEVTGLLRGYATREGAPLASWANVVGFLAGLAVMYLTALLVKF